MATYQVKAPDGKTITLQGPAGASQEDIIAQAQALSAMTWGEPGEVFRSQSDAIQENFMWTLNSLIDRIAAMHRNLEERAINSGPTS